MDPSGAGKWLLISDCAASDVTATRLADAFREHSAACTTMRWPLHDDQLAAADQLRDQVGSDEFSGVVVLTGSNTGTPHQGARIAALSTFAGWWVSLANCQTFPGRCRACTS